MSSEPWLNDPIEKDDMQPTEQPSEPSRPIARTSQVVTAAPSAPVKRESKPMNAPYKAPAVITKAKALNWNELSTREVQDRRWAMRGWCGFGHVTLLVGPGGIGKSLLAQEAASCLALGRDFIEIGRAHV